MSTTTTNNHHPNTKPKPKPKSAKPPSKPTRVYLTLYNLLSFTLWATSTVHALSLLLLQQTPLPQIFTAVFPLLLATQSLALLEILHSVVGLVRAPVFTTAMQVASRILLVWGIMYLFREGGVAVAGTGAGAGAGAGEAGRKGIVGVEGMEGGEEQMQVQVQVADYGFLGCVFAWGITECIRYGFFVLQVSGLGVPAWWAWLRYNTFYVLYPLGITSECVMVVMALGPAAEWMPVYRWFLVVVLGIYVPGSYILYTHMIAQRRKALKKKD
ncbi:PTPLA-domain-containing protein [Aspergillus heteromorphus CBS 117.55]|uniref:Very-long-chain (3R)-3-hydroxyacyl-CoA dehydratase n=1 Tax=Aspergillus heteromorphus CBS 117.55 TaxID=1448321 RepID=A0A317WRG0_9EURO|nr:PTPLA-domain-containing protein [Aspergillus heteromorphus CBS 117.55]PWY87707.1 PTPLA-domain-containing protein [Aspergillus heteromorphus CBS 117.55]